MEAYGQFAWKLRHYRAGPPASNHSSNGPVCRHLGGRLSEKDLLLLPFSLRPLIAALLFSLSLSHTLSLFLSLTAHAAFMEPRFRFPLAKDLQITGNEYQRRISEVLSAGTGPAPLDPDPNPFHDQRPIHFLFAFDRYFRSFWNRSFFFSSLCRSFSKRIESSRISFRDSQAEFGCFFFPPALGSRSRGKGRREDRFGGQICCITWKYGIVRNLFRDRNSNDRRTNEEEEYQRHTTAPKFQTFLFSFFSPPVWRRNERELLERLRSFIRGVD